MLNGFIQININLTSTGKQQEANHHAKGAVLKAKRPSFTSQETAF